MNEKKYRWSFLTHNVGLIFICIHRIQVAIKVGYTHKRKGVIKKLNIIITTIIVDKLGNK